MGLVLVMLVAGRCSLHIVMKKRSKKNQETSEKCFKKLAEEDEDGFKQALGTKSLFELRDQFGNNIFHLAARSSWTETMTNIVLGGESIDVETPLKRCERTDIFSHQRLPHSEGWQSKIATFFKMPYCSPKLTVFHFNSRNQAGDTPLMIAASNLQTDSAKALVKTGHVEINLESGGRTALHKAVAAYPKQRSQKKSQDICVELVKYLLEQGATPQGYVDGHTPLHTAVCKGALGIVISLAEVKNGPVVENKSQDGKGETALQLAERLEEKEIVDHLKKYNISCNSTKEEIPAVAGGHKNDAYSGDCLMRAVHENKHTSASFLHNNLPPPNDTSRLEATKNMKTLESMLDNKENDQKKKSTRNITAVNERDTQADEFKNEAKKLITNIKRKLKRNAVEEMNEDLEQLEYLVTEN